MITAQAVPISVPGVLAAYLVTATHDDDQDLTITVRPNDTRPALVLLTPLRIEFWVSQWHTLGPWPHHREGVDLQKQQVPGSASPEPQLLVTIFA